MLTLYIIRHAKASHEDHFPGDFYRTLDKKGYAEGQEMSDWFSGQKNLPKHFISSPAVRAFSTALIFAEQLNYNPDQIQLSYSVYEASSRRLLNVINETDDKHKSVALFGHNPGLSDLVNELCGTTQHNLATSGVAGITLEATSWSKVKGRMGKLLFIKAP